MRAIVGGLSMVVVAFTGSAATQARIDVCAPAGADSVRFAVIGDSGTGDEEQYAVAARMNDAGSLVTLTLDGRRPARYVLVWLTSLPTEAVNRYVGGVSEVTVRR